MKQSCRIVTDRNSKFVTCAALLHQNGEAPLSEKPALKNFFASSDPLVGNEAQSIEKEFETLVLSKNILLDFFSIENLSSESEILLQTQAALDRLRRRVLHFSISQGEAPDSEQILATMSFEPLFKKLFFKGKPVLVLDSRTQNFECRLTRKLSDWITAESAKNSDLFKQLASLCFSDLEKKKILLHVCCGPDAAGVINQLKRDYDVTCFWYDPNIQPREEHDKRLDAFLKVAQIEDVKTIIGEYDVENFYERIEGLEHTPEQGAKCSQCYDLRLERAAVEAKDLGCDLYTTTLAISPHKVQQKLSRFGELNQKKYGVPYLTRNFMKDEGFKKSVEYTRDFNIYRQDYCGCYFSLHEGGKVAQQMAASLGLLSSQPAPEGNPFRGKDPEHAYVGEVNPSTFSLQTLNSLNTKPTLATETQPVA